MLSQDDHPWYSAYTVKWATLDWEKEEAFALRRRVFCEEQALFEGDDRDHKDGIAQLLVALGGYGGWHERIVGTVRIHAENSGLWYGSRLAVDPFCRTHGHIGSTLIRLAVSSAHALGCRCFRALVQKQNEALFHHLHWHSLTEKPIYGQLHILMEADLSCYPPCHTPLSGFVIRARQEHTDADLSPPLLGMPVPSLPGLRPLWQLQ
ncbi:MAG: MSMEG_0567/Sll0786 family nitrogen starvation N-acetyltransferase [Pseudomonadota bacterium]|nr:MSMEG_0567/Sll0786 family nitrogen starvation N-acetyltransferase [Pseudomonadota bacterium]